jgi:hypothetical protein
MSNMSFDAPIVVATMLCNEVIEDVRSRNKSAIGIFNAVNTAVLPAVHPRMFVFVSVTNVKGFGEFSIVLRSPSGKALVDIQGQIEQADPVAVYDLVVELLGVPLEEEGVHFVDVMHKGTILGGRRFTVLQGANG